MIVATQIFWGDQQMQDYCLIDDFWPWLKFHLWWFPRFQVTMMKRHENIIHMFRSSILGVGVRFLKKLRKKNAPPSH